VYGIVRQSNGYVKVYSEVGMGTTFRILLPRVDKESEAAPMGGGATKLASGNETILVAEDQEGVRVMTRKILERCGYRILTAEGPSEALELASDYSEQIDLILTDVVMPDMSGPQLVERLSPILPDTPVIFMSGYTDDQLQHHGVLDEGVILIEKPFTAMTLSAAVREVLDKAADGDGLARSA
jgi:CheY-like chemotaxis protein